MEKKSEKKTLSDGNEIIIIDWTKAEKHIFICCYIYLFAIHWIGGPKRHASGRLVLIISVFFFCCCCSCHPMQLCMIHDVYTSEKIAHFSIEIVCRLWLEELSGLFNERTMILSIDKINAIQNVWPKWICTIFYPQFSLRIFVCYERGLIFYSSCMCLTVCAWCLAVEDTRLPCFENACAHSNIYVWIIEMIFSSRATETYKFCTAKTNK